MKEYVAHTDFFLKYDMVFFENIVNDVLDSAFQTVGFKGFINR